MSIYIYYIYIFNFIQITCKITFHYTPKRVSTPHFAGLVKVLLVKIEKLNYRTEHKICQNILLK